MALLSNELQVIDGEALGMHGFHSPPVTLLPLNGSQSLPVFPLSAALAVEVGTVVLPASPDVSRACTGESDH